MVNTVSAINGQAVAKIDSDEPDEPPLPQPNAHERRTTVSSGSETCSSSIPTTANSFAEKASIDEALRSSWNGDAKTAHAIDIAALSTFLDVNLRDGLSNKEAASRLERDGPNKLAGAGGVSVWQVLLRQVSNSLTIVLLIAMALSYGTLDYIEGAVISAVILLNIILGFVQDFRAEKTVQSLLGLAAPTSKVIRDGGRIEFVKAESLVLGDIIQIAIGDVVPADVRLIDSTNLEADEALLTGESLPTSKSSVNTLTSWELTLGDRTNMAYSATTITRGRGTAIVIATGMKTEVGSVAELLRGQSTEVSSNVVIKYLKKFGRGIKSVLGLVGTPLQVKLSKFAILLFALALLLAIIVFSANKWHLGSEVILYGICVAVAVIPESLIAVMTITVAVGVKAMARGNVVVRRMASLEAIGGVTNICSDKTGTLTQGKMVARKVWVPDVGILSVSDTTSTVDPTDGRVTLGEASFDHLDPAFQKQTASLVGLLDAVALCNLATVYKYNDINTQSNEKRHVTSEWVAIGDPTEIALQVLSMRFGHGKATILGNEATTHITEHPFDSTLKRMSVAYRRGESKGIEVYTKGASEAILSTLGISDGEQADIKSTIEKFAKEGLRVLVVASKTVSLSDEHRVWDRSFAESNLNFCGLVALYDPPRVETLAAVKKCHKAGIVVHMLTGDHLSTATAIANQVGILKPEIFLSKGNTAVMKAEDFDQLTDAQIDAMECLPLVLARCSPTTKVRMVEALHRRQAFCVMTGDGVNDAPALKRAHVGIAMGVNGTDVAKDAADMVLTDDNFASIVKAVEEGRRLFDNIQKFLMHLLISNIAQVILLLIALAFKDSDGDSIFPLSPLEILWANMITSSFLALGLGMEEAQVDIMVRPPHDLKAGVFTWELIIDKMIYGTFSGTLCLISFVAVVYGAGGGNLGEQCNQGYSDSCTVVFRARATVFSVLSFLLLVTAWEVKHFSRSLFALDPIKYKGRFSVFKALVANRFLFWAVVGGFLTTFPVVYIPVVNVLVFKHLGISWEWGIVAGCVVVYVALVESWKAVKRRFGIYSGKLRTFESEVAV